MLNAHLIAKFAAKAKACNVITWRDYRITLLEDKLVRIEKSEDKIFRDAATQCVWFRDFFKVNYKFDDYGDYAELSTSAFVLSLKKNREDCRIDIGKGFMPIGNERNLKGTFRTLDGCDGDVMASKLKHSEYLPGERIRLSDGVCSESGIAVLDDSSSLSLTDDGKIIGEKAHGSDEYVFAYGDDYRGAVKALYAICGKTPLLPRFAFGNWWSRYYAYTQDEYISLTAKFERNGIPLTVATIDMDWHYSDYDEITEKFRLRELNRQGEEYTTDDRRKEMLGWTGYTWNERLFPDYKKMFAELKKRNLKTVLNLHPAQGIRFWENCYEEMSTAVGADSRSGKVIPFDFTDDKFINAYFSVIHKPYEKDGVDFWWIDWQQGVKSNTAGLDPLWALNHYHFLDHSKNHSQPLILSRYAGVGSHRYPIGFSGDAYMTWNTLEYLPYFTATASNVGYGWWSHDIGGHGHGEKSDELYLRSVQFGVFSPINRLHCTNQSTMSKEPWNYGAYGLIAENFLRLRHSMIPFLYTANRISHVDGKTLCEPLYYEYKNEKAYRYKNEYLFGGLLVVPITSKMSKDGFAHVKAWLPKGEWTDIFTGDRYCIESDGEERTLLRNEESIPVLAKAGSVIPYSDDGGNSCANPENLRLQIFAGNGKYTLLEDDENGENTALTDIAVTREENGSESVVKVTIISSGIKSTVPKNRTVTVEFFGEKQCKTKLFKNSVVQDVEKTYGEYSSVKFVYDADSVYSVEFVFKRETDLDFIKRRAENALLVFQGNNDEKFNAYKTLAGTDSVKSFYETLEKLWGFESVKQRLIEIKPFY